MALIGYNAIWEYQEVTNDIPADPTAVTVPSSGWTAGGVAPFGNGVADAYGNEPNTSWALSTGLWIRRNVQINGAQAVRLEGFVDNAMYLYWDGEFIGAVNPTLDAEAGDWIMIVPMELCTAGTHSLALLCLEDDFTPGGDRSFISLVADYVPILMPFQPRAPVQETLSWLTDIQTAKDGTEERTQFRIKARQTLKYTFPLDNDKMRRAFLLVYDKRHVQWAVPIWTQATHVGAIAEGANQVSASGTTADYRVGEYALLWQAHDRYQIVMVTAKSSGTVSFAEEAREFTDAWAMPLRLGFIPNNPSKSLTGYQAEYEMTFQIEDNLGLEPSAPAQYLGEDIYYDVSLLSGDTLSDDIVGNLELQDEELGIVKYYAPWLNTKVARTHRVVCEDQAEAWAFRQWLYRRAGRFRGFWQPSFEADLKCLSTGTIGTSMNIAADGYIAHGTQHTHIAIETTTGWLVRTISNPTYVSETVTQVTLSSSLGVNAANIKRICWLGFKRLNSDNVEISWPGGGVCEADMRLLELNA